VTRAQTLFVVALAVVALLITLVSVYVASSTRWGDRWYRRGSGRS
jgi:hypothetical protein